MQRPFNIHRYKRKQTFPQALLNHGILGVINNQQAGALGSASLMFQTIKKDIHGAINFLHIDYSNLHTNKEG